MRMARLRGTSGLVITRVARETARVCEVWKCRAAAIKYIHMNCPHSCGRLLAINCSSSTRDAIPIV